ncbi:hypothetical protein ZWY2020_009277 [Hordeum vulgare]|nr:hypothetical protein ZWY2020_009277 [Hordeum vulgare]
MLMVFDDPVTEGPALPVGYEEPAARAQGFYFYDKKESIVQRMVLLLTRVQLKGMEGHPQPHGAYPMDEETRDFSVVGGTGDFFMARGIATIRTDVTEGFRLKMDIKLYECYVKKKLYLIRTNPRSALLQRRRFDSELRPSLTFRGFSPASIASLLAAIPRLILPRSAGRLCPQRPFPSPSSSYHRRVAAALTLAFLNWSHFDASQGRPLTEPGSPPLATTRLPHSSPPPSTPLRLTATDAPRPARRASHQALAAFHQGQPGAS